MGSVSGAHRLAPSYFTASRAPLTSAIVVLPLFVIYQVGVLSTGGVGNGVDFMTTLLHYAVGNNIAAYLVINAMVFLGFVGAIFHFRNQGTFRGRWLPMMLVEAGIYSLCVGSVVNYLMDFTNILEDVHLAAGAEASMSPLTSIVMSVGAGLYEELVFRLFLMGGLFFIMHRLAGMSRIPASIVAVLTSSLVFSAVHHIGSLGEPFTMVAFTFRFFAGVVFAAIFQTRGLAIAAWTHALYDVWIMVFRDP